MGDFGTTVRTARSGRRHATQFHRLPAGVSWNGSCTIGAIGASLRVADDDHMNRATMQRFGFAILCGVAGFALNSLPEVTLGPLLLGRVVTLPVAILLGPWFGGLAAVIGGAATRGSSLGLIAIILLSLEGVLVGLFSRRGCTARATCVRPSCRSRCSCPSAGWSR
ncbi:MAG: hypothetical protein A3F69_05020 [Acidobacteria bacterium RIFCSPLOWO2_12_FULL_66_10]|nr:MAG: hypothetical protein A3F69_05020 [Acidobacteria bacterium RIFCSPLOWO2_12_FULL_66_10]